MKVQVEWIDGSAASFVDVDSDTWNDVFYVRACAT